VTGIVRVDAALIGFDLRYGHTLFDVPECAAAKALRSCGRLSSEALT